MKPVRPILLGIAGDSASGKTTMAEGIVSVLGPERVTSICCDDYHRHTRAERKELGLSALDPACNYVDIMQGHFAQLRRGEAILKPLYDHETGTFLPPEYVEPREFVVVEGLLAFHTARMRDAFDVKIYLDPQEELRVDWQVRRNTARRGYTRDEVRESITRRRAASEAFIRPQRRFADMVLHFHRPQERNAPDGELNADLILRPTIRHPDFSEFIDPRPDSRERCLTLTLGRDEGMPVDILRITGTIRPVTAETLMDLVMDSLPVEGVPEQGGVDTASVGSYRYGAEERTSYPLAISQLLTCYHLINMRLAAVA